MQKTFRKFAKTALVLVYLVIIAGAVVRMTGSGMGCPDWPKCFGYYIPPTESSQLEFKPNHAYKKGIVIIKDEALLVATKDFKSAENINLNNWETYTKHDYATFNPTHTWVEYINRLTGALSGIPILIFTIISFWLWQKNKWLTLLSIATVIGMGFQAWLGKTVVDSNLAPYKITIHMVMAMVIVAMILYLIYASKLKFSKQIFDPAFRNVIIVALLLSLAQIILGTQIRQHIDERIKDIGYIKSQWMADPTLKFYIHRSFSVLVVFINGWLFFRTRKLGLGYHKINLLMLCIFAEIISGIAMYYFDFPFLSQPIHLVIALIMFGIQFYIYLESRHKKAVLT
ncbi:heme A synthase [Psychroserpens sp. SPM9]|uniref:COX15/CtaA family protein n=1 Tax=Psychroserpens sp. SPM9 TaxID=2975598 RepID=UPI0021A8A43D|nr:COX15/CtaA family protein [Psychroserpens sp. SPM9]MDG5492371.1 COX15/CtaA family protein [Psychroserpens sp. SPM9]